MLAPRQTTRQGGGDAQQWHTVFLRRVDGARQALLLFFQHIPNRLTGRDRERVKRILQQQQRQRGVRQVPNDAGINGYIQHAPHEIGYAVKLHARVREGASHEEKKSNQRGVVAVFQHNKPPPVRGEHSAQSATRSQSAQKFLRPSGEHPPRLSLHILCAAVRREKNGCVLLTTPGIVWCLN